MSSTTRVLNAIMLLFCCLGYSQGFQKTESEAEEQFKRKFSFAFFLQNVNPTGDNFAGKGLKGGVGAGFRIHYYVLDNMYLGGALGYDGLRVDDVTVVGQYDRIIRFNAYIYFGYDHKINNQFRLLSDIGYGHSENRNRQNSNQGRAKYKDTGGILCIGTALDFLVSDKVAIYMGPDYEFVFYDIDAPSNLKSDFKRGNYFNITLGVRLITPK